MLVKDLEACPRGLQLPMTKVGALTARKGMSVIWGMWGSCWEPYELGCDS